MQENNVRDAGRAAPDSTRVNLPAAQRSITDLRNVPAVANGPILELHVNFFSGDDERSVPQSLYDKASIASMIV